MTQVFTIDNGNSNPNIGFFENGLLTDVLLKADFMSRFKILPADVRAIMADVGFPNELPDFFGDRLLRLGAYRTKNGFLDMPVNYAATLGEDRLALGFHVYKTMPRKLPALVVDSGTFTTIDVVDKNGFMGGYIFPGIRRFYEIYGQSARLPDLSSAAFAFDAPKALPRTTPEAILQAGQAYWTGVFKEILTLGYDFKTILVTGGDAQRLEPLLKRLCATQEIIVDLRLIHLSLYTVYQNIQSLKQPLRSINHA